MTALEGKVALVSGSGRGIGQQIALKLARAGAAVVVNDLDADPARETVEKITAEGGRATAVVGSVLDADFPDELTAVEYDVLFNLARLPGRAARPRDLNPLLLISQPSVSRLIDRLAERGLVTKTPDPEDGRGTVVTLTEEGFRRFRRVAAVHSTAIAERFGDVLDAAELRTLIALCDRLLNA